MPAADEPAAGDLAGPVGPGGQADILLIEDGLETHDAADREIAAEEIAHELGVVFDNMKHPVLNSIAERRGKLLGLTPPSGSTALVFFLAANHMLVSGLSMMGFVIVTSMIADIVEETELRTGRRSEGLLFAADTFLQKVSTGVATFLPGLMVTYIGLPIHARPKTWIRPS